jgi:hypothetical protein
MKPITWRQDETNFSGQKAQVGTCEVLYQTVNFGGYRHRYSVWWSGGHLACFFEEKLNDSDVEDLVSMIGMMRVGIGSDLRRMKGTLEP